MASRHNLASPTTETSGDVPFATSTDAPVSNKSTYLCKNAIAATAFFVLGMGGVLLWYFGTDPVPAFTELPPAYSMTACQVCAQLNYSDMVYSKYSQYNSIEKICPTTVFPGADEWVPMKHISPTCCCPVTATRREGSGYYYSVDIPYPATTTANSTCACPYKYSSKSDMGDGRGWYLIIAGGVVLLVTICWCCVMLCMATCCG